MQYPGIRNALPLALTIFAAAALTSCFVKQGVVRQDPAAQDSTAQDSTAQDSTMQDSAPKEDSPRKRLDMCTLLKTMQPCLDKAATLLSRINSCGALGQSYGEGVREEATRLGLENPEQAGDAATFTCAGICALKRNDAEMTWSSACMAAARAMHCNANVCAPPNS